MRNRIIHLVVTTKGDVMTTISRPQQWTEAGMTHAKTLRVYNYISNASYIRLLKVLPQNNRRITKTNDFTAIVAKA